MKGEVRILSARRAYEFAGDAIQVAAFALPEVQQRLRTALEIPGQAIPGTVMPGGALQLGQPGFTFQGGRFQSEIGSVPVRFISFESSRVTLDILGPTRLIDKFFAFIRETLESVSIAGGRLLSGDLERHSDTSELTVQLDADLVVFLASPVLKLARERLPRDEGQTITVTLRLEILNSNEAYPGGEGVPRQHLLQMRAGTRVADRVAFSLAPLGTEAHTDYLRDLERAVAKQQHSSETESTPRFRAHRRPTPKKSS